MIQVIGAGLAGCEAAWQIAQAGERVVLREMKPQRFLRHIKALYLQSWCAPTP